MASIIQLRRGTAANWSGVNPILAEGELGVEIDTSKIKVGDGINPWNSLDYLQGETSTGNTNFTYVQAVPSATWNITHNMGYNPSVNVIDSGGNNVTGAVVYNTDNHLTIIFSAGFSGTAYLS